MVQCTAVRCGVVGGCAAQSLLSCLSYTSADNRQHAAAYLFYGCIALATLPTASLLCRLPGSYFLLPHKSRPHPCLLPALDCSRLQQFRGRKCRHLQRWLRQSGELPCRTAAAVSVTLSVGYNSAAKALANGRLPGRPVQQHAAHLPTVHATQLPAPQAASPLPATSGECCFPLRVQSFAGACPGNWWQYWLLNGQCWQ